MTNEIRKLERENAAYRKANPWRIVNVQSSQTLCGRHPTRDAAIEAAQSYGGMIGEELNTILVSQMPRL